MTVKTVDDVFGKTGVLSEHFENYEPRAGQVALARAIEKALAAEEHLLAEAPTGTGKSLAYSAPAVMHAATKKTRVVIATANIALQEQLVHKDLPLLAKLLPHPFRFALLKGRSNYACLDRAAATAAQGGFRLGDQGQAGHAAHLVKWCGTTKSGDISELPFAPAPALWSRFSVSADNCKRTGCEHRAKCFSELAKRRAEASEIVVTNFHQLFAHIAVRRMTGGNYVLPAFDVLICDEAHELADVARSFFGSVIAPPTIGSLVKAACHVGSTGIADVLRQEGERFFAALSSHRTSSAYSGRIRVPGTLPTDILVGAIDTLVTALGSRLDGLEDDAERRRCETAQRRATMVSEDLSRAGGLEDDNLVVSLHETPEGGTELRTTLLSVAHVMRREVFATTKSVLLVSGTLAVNQTFGFIERELGIPKNTPTLVADTPFDFPRQSLLVIPEGIPDPGDATYPAAMAAIIAEVAPMTNGGILVLFTSYRNLRAVAAALPPTQRIVLQQGDAPAKDLVRRFKADRSSVLLATTSFWTGIDVPGDALTVLVIDKMPFPHPSDPLVDAMRERDPGSFQNFELPKAIMILRQGVGRLIRARTDKGAVIICDHRLQTKRYGARVLRSLPPMPVSHQVASIAAFLGVKAHAA